MKKIMAAVIAIFFIIPINLGILAVSPSWAETYWEKVRECTDVGVCYDLEVFNGKLYVADKGVWCHNSGTSWTWVFDRALVISMTTFNNKLYIGTDRNLENNGAQVWETNDGIHWTQINTDGFGSTNNWECNSLCVYNNKLYAGVSPQYGALKIFRYEGGTNWVQVSAEGFGDDNNYKPLSMIAYDGYLWVGTGNTETGSEVWRYDGSSWEQMNTDGFGSSTIDSTASFVAYNNKLYCGTGQDMARVFRWDGGTVWSQVGSTGLGDTHNYHVLSLATYGGKLFAGTRQLYADGCQVCSWNGSSWVLENTPGFGDPQTSEARAMTVFDNKLYVGTVGATAQVWMTDGSPYTPPTPYALYLAEGSTDWGFSCYITIENPNSQDVQVKVTYQTSSGEKAGPTITMPALSQATINPAETLGSADFSTKIECTSGLPIAADRTMIWNSGSGEEGHSAVAVTAPAKTWYLPEGSSKWGFECFLLIQNPNTTPAHVTITYMTQDQGAIPVQVEVPASSRGTYNMKDHIGEADSSIKVTSDIPVIPERAMYRNSRREGHDSIGTTLPASDYYLAEGATGWDVGFEIWVLVQNPNNSANTVSLTFMTQNGQVPGPSFTMAPNSRQSLKLNNYLPPNTDVSTRVHGEKPIIAERAMYWKAGGQEICHDSVGMDAPHTVFYLPDGQTDNGRETWTLVQNPNSTDVTVEISYLTPDGQGNVKKTETVPANSRRTFNMLEHSGIFGRAAIMVACKTSGKKIMVERAMYWNSRGAGTDTIGGYSD